MIRSRLCTKTRIVPSPARLIVMNRKIKRNREEEKSLEISLYDALILLFTTLDEIRHYFIIHSPLSFTYSQALLLHRLFLTDCQ